MEELAYMEYIKNLKDKNTNKSEPTYFFMNEAHKENFLKLMELYKRQHGKDPQYEATFYVAAVPDIYILLGKLNNIDTSRSPLYELMVYFEDQARYVPVADGLTGSTTQMVKFALSLYNDYEVGLDDVLGSVTSKEYLDVLIQAFKIRAKYFYL
jgi:hypothetical protein